MTEQVQSTLGPPPPCAYCDAQAWRLVACFDAPPKGETNFDVSPYWRELWSCRVCQHAVNRQDFDPSTLYDAAYWDRTYGGDRMAATYHKIMALPEALSDNRARVKRVCAFADGGQSKRLLDVGSGLAVFPAAMKAEGWACTALDPDPRGARHAEDIAGVSSITGDFAVVQGIGPYDLISFNKVLEHVSDPVTLLRKARAFLEEGGFVYVELPDAVGALAEGPGREEFFIEHYCAYSKQSFVSLAEQAGYRVEAIEAIVEPSSKYTLYGFLSPIRDAQP